MKSSPFQIGITILFVVLTLLAVAIFSGVIKTDDPAKDGGASGAVMLWGPYKKDHISKFLDEYNQSHQSFSVIYVEVPADRLDNDLVEAIASDAGPDLIILPQEGILRNRSKLYMIPYQSITERTFRDTYVQEGELFMLSGGIVALPLTIDPLIMYYNRNMFEAAGITQPPKTWNELTNHVPKLTKKGQNVTILQSALPFGIYENLNHAKDVLSMLLMQAGNPIVVKQNDKFFPVLLQNQSDQNSPAQAVVDFFTQFSDPNKETYTWNRSFTNARDQFINEELAIYFGYASELPIIASKNPNLNFDVTKVPQATDARAEVTFGEMQAVAVVKSSKNFQTAFKVASDLTGPDLLSKLIGALIQTSPVAPARRDMLSKAPENLYGPTLYNSAVISRGWYDPGEALTNPIFSDMVDKVSRGALSTQESTAEAHNRLLTIIK